ncbi:MAG: amino acid racemase [Ferruginibacter sp.]
MKKLGLVGGISWVSTIDYYRFINEAVNDYLGGLNFAECIVYSLNFNDFQRNNSARDWEATFRLLLNACENLKKAGAEAIVLCANTAHVVADRIKENINMPLIHIVGATAEEIKKTHLKKLGLIGTIFTMEMDFFKNKLLEYGIESIVPASQVERDFLQKTIKEELGKGIIDKKTKHQYISIINELVLNGAEGIILGCTELPLIISEQDIPVPVFDTTKIHAKAAVQFALSK